MMKRLVLTLCLVCAVVMGAMANDLATFEVQGSHKVVISLWHRDGYGSIFRHGKILLKKQYLLRVKTQTNELSEVKVLYSDHIHNQFIPERL